jgi:hypothetical protein
MKNDRFEKASAAVGRLGMTVTKAATLDWPSDRSFLELRGYFGKALVRVAR